jgi:hypothetical protein
LKLDVPKRRRKNWAVKLNHPLGIGSASQEAALIFLDLKRKQFWKLKYDNDFQLKYDNDFQLKYDNDFQLKYDNDFKPI